MSAAASPELLLDPEQRGARRHRVTGPSPRGCHRPGGTEGPRGFPGEERPPPRPLCPRHLGAPARPAPRSARTSLRRRCPLCSPLPARTVTYRKWRPRPVPSAAAMLLWRRLVAPRVLPASRRLSTARPAPAPGQGAGPAPGEAAGGAEPLPGQARPVPRSLTAARSSLLPSGPSGDGGGALRPLYMDVQATTPLVRAALGPGLSPRSCRRPGPRVPQRTVQREGQK